MDSDTATELLIAQLLEDDLRLLLQAKEAEDIQVAQTLSDSTAESLDGQATPPSGLPDFPATGEAADDVFDNNKTVHDTELAVLSILAIDARLRSDALYARTLQHAGDAADIAGRQYAQQLVAREKKFALDAEFAKRLQQMVDNGEEIATRNIELDAERVLGTEVIESILANDPNDKGKGKAPLRESVPELVHHTALEAHNELPHSNAIYNILDSAQMCGICLEPFTLVHSPNNAVEYRPTSTSDALPFGMALPCPGSHTYCHSCIGGYIQSRLDPEGDGSGNPNTVVFPIRCPECLHGVWDEGISEDVAVRVLGEKSMLLWHHQKLLDSLPHIYCPNRHCSALVQAEENVDAPQAECPACTATICVPCKVIWHQDMTCEQFQSLPLDERSPEDQQALQLMRAEHWQRCPNCDMIVELTHGCNHIICRCGTHFCFKCGALWDKKTYKCTRVPSCLFWTEEMLLERRERQQPQHVQRAEQPLRVFLPPAARPVNRRRRDLIWMQDPGILSRKHQFTRWMVGSLTCQYCNRVSDSLANLQYHLESTRHQVFACCGRFFQKEGDLQRHTDAGGWVDHEYEVYH